VQDAQKRHVYTTEGTNRLSPMRLAWMCLCCECTTAGMQNDCIDVRRYDYRELIGRVEPGSEDRENVWNTF